MEEEGALEAAMEEQEETLLESPEEHITEGAVEAQGDKKEEEQKQVTEAVEAQANSAQNEAKEVEQEEAPAPTAPLSILEEATMALAAQEQVAGWLDVKATPDTLVAEVDRAVGDAMAKMQTYAASLAQLTNAVTAAMAQMPPEAQSAAAEVISNLNAAQAGIEGAPPVGAHCTVEHPGGINLQFDVTFSSLSTAGAEAAAMYLTAIEGLREEGAEMESETEVELPDDDTKK